MFIEDDYTADYSAMDEQADNVPEVEDRRPIDFGEARPAITGEGSGQNSHSDGQEPSQTDGSEVQAVDSLGDSVGERETPVPDSQDKVNGGAADWKKTDQQHAVMSADT
ncbi:hypothetical protein ACOMHN_017485 [Nucella lapillus]